MGHVDVVMEWLFNLTNGMASGFHALMEESFLGLSVFSLLTFGGLITYLGIAVIKWLII